MDLLKKENKKAILKVFIISLFIQIISIFPVWVAAVFLGVNFSLISVYIFMPIISLILLLPISVAGLGAREQLYLFFFSQVGITQEKILLVSTYQSVMGIIVSLIFGLFFLVSPIIWKFFKEK